MRIVDLREMLNNHRRRSIDGDRSGWNSFWAKMRIVDVDEMLNNSHRRSIGGDRSRNIDGIPLRIMSRKIFDQFVSRCSREEETSNHLGAPTARIVQSRWKNHLEEIRQDRDGVRPTFVESEAKRSVKKITIDEDRRRTSTQEEQDELESSAEQG